MHSLVLYTREGCGLCEQLVLALELMRLKIAFDYDTVDIDNDPALQRRYHELVPVLCDGETEICAGLCDPADIERYLQTIAT